MIAAFRFPSNKQKVLLTVVGIEINYVSFTFVGQYSLVEPDGSIRTVDYTADPVNGFNAV